MVPLAGRGDVGLKASGLQGLGCRFAVITASQRRRDHLYLTRIVPVWLNCRLLQGLQYRLTHRFSRLFVVRYIRHVAGHYNLIGPIHTGLGIPTVVPTFVVRLHDVQLGIREAHLGFVSWCLIDLFGRFAPSLLSAPLALSFCLTAALAFGV